MTDTPNSQPSHPPDPDSNTQNIPSSEIFTETGLDSGFYSSLVGVTKPTTDLGTSVHIEPLTAPLEGEALEALKTKVPFYNQSIAKVLLFSVAAIAGCGLWLLTQKGEDPAPAAAKPSETQTEKVASFEPDTRFAEMQNKVAMQDEADQISAQAKEIDRQKLQKQVAAAAPVVATKSDAQSDTSASKATPAQTIATSTEPDPAPPTNVEPPIVPTRAAVANTPTSTPKVARSAPAPSVTPTPSTIAPKPAATSAPTAKTPQPIRSVRTATRLPMVPIVGKASPLENRAPVIKPAPAPTRQVSWQEATNNAVGVFGRQQASAVPSATPTATATSTPTATSTVAASGRKIVAGQNRIASLITPFQALAGEQSQEVLLNLDQGFIDTQGRMPIPANSKIQATVTVANNGMLRITDAKIDVGGVEYQIATGNLMLVATNNQPVVAELKNFNGGEIARRDMQTAAIGALQGLGQILTTPNTQTQITGSGSAISTTSSNPNVVGGILNGAASPLVQQWAQRNQAEIQRIESNTRAWYVPAGTKVVLYSTRSFEVR